jgi:hypothetical protein
MPNTNELIYGIVIYEWTGVWQLIAGTYDMSNAVSIAASFERDDGYETHHIQVLDGRSMTAIGRKIDWLNQHLWN